MALENTVTRETFVGNGVTTSFDFSFKVWETSEILVYTSASKAWKEDDVTESVTVTLNDGDEPGGTVTFRTAPESGVTIAVVRNMPFIQEDRYINGVKFDAKEIEDRFDQDCAERQQLREGLSRAVVVPYTDSRTVEEYTDDFWTAVDDTLENKNISCECARKSCECADYAEGQADRAEAEADRAEDAAIVGTHIANIDATWTLEEDIAAGTTITLPHYYYPKRNVLRMSYDGVEMYLGPQFEEVGENADKLSNQVTILCDLRAGMQLHMWVVMSNLARYAEDLIAALKEALGKVEEAKDECIEEMQEDLAEYLEDAEACKDAACKCAKKAKKSQQQAANNAADANESADRADDAAVDAENAAEAAKRAALCSYIYRRGRRLGATLADEYLDYVPNGFWIVNENIVLPATIQHPLTPLPDEEAVPDYCEGFFLIAPAFTDAYPCPDFPPPPPPPSTGNPPIVTKHKMLMPCGARARYSTAG